ncbi:DMT family transporter [Ralstonia solanacearum]|uniref:DMT family transporter n=1 Tax=Ralstonia solanacearum TaxID=305 RepID=UPI000F623610|nr:DMT family transporter [Ralstonia solanacearum]
MTTASSTSSASTRSADTGGLLLASVGAVLFSAKAIVAKLMYRYQVDAVMVITLRMLLAAPIFLAMGWWQSRRSAPLAPADRWRIVGLGIIGYYLSSFLDFLGLQYITAGLERLILFLTPSFVLLITATVFKRRIVGLQWLSMAIAYAGIVLVFAHDLNLGGRHVWLGAGLVLASGELVKRVGSMRLVAYAMCVSTVACIVQFLVLRPVSALVLPWQVYGLSAINSVFCTVAPVTLTMMAVARVGAPVASQAGMIGPVSTLLLGWWLLGEPITLWQIGGSALVLAGMALLSRRGTQSN